MGKYTDILNIKDILKNGSKAKLIQLAIDTPEFSIDGIGYKTLSREDIQTIKDKAKKEGWDGELFRATYKAKDIEAMLLVARGQVYEALYSLQIFLKDIQKGEVILGILQSDYLRDYNEDTGKYDTVKDSTREEIREYILRLKRGVCNPIENINLLVRLKSIDDTFAKEEKFKDKKVSDKDFTIATFKYYKQIINSAKMGFYLVIKSKFGGYRLYKKEPFTSLKSAFAIDNFAVAIEVHNSLTHIDYLLETLQNYKPEILEEIGKDKDVYIPERSEIAEMQEFLDTHIISANSHLSSTPDKEGEDKLLSEEYLLSGLDDKTKELVTESNVKLEEYVRYGK